jgi:hypothetical protein
VEDVFFAGRVSSVGSHMREEGLSSQISVLKPESEPNDRTLNQILAYFFL